MFTAEFACRHVGSIPLTLGTETLQNIGIGDQQFCKIYGDWPRQDFRIFYRHLYVQVAEVAAVETLVNAQFFASGKSSGIQPSLVVESRRGYNQRIAFPFTRRISHPCWKRIHGKLAAIRVDLAKDSICL